MWYVIYNTSNIKDKTPKWTDVFLAFLQLYHKCSKKFHFWWHKRKCHLVSSVPLLNLVPVQMRMSFVHKEFQFERSFHFCPLIKMLCIINVSMVFVPKYAILIWHALFFYYELISLCVSYTKAKLQSKSKLKFLP